MKRVFIKKALTVAISICIALILLEVVLRIFNTPKPVISGWKTLNSYPSERHQLGFRGQPIQYQEDDFVIVLIGDSQVEAKACAYGWMPEQRLQFYLNSNGKKVKVFSLGGPATGQDEQLLSLREYYEKFRADLVILWFTPTNDVWNNTFPTNVPDDRTPKPTFWLENGQLRGPTELTGQPARETPSLRLTRLWRKFFPYPREKEWARSILPPPYTPMTRYDGPVSDDWQKRMNELPNYLKYENFDSDKNDRAMKLTPRSPRVQYGLDLTHSLMQEMQRLAASHNAQFAIFTTDKHPNAPKDQSASQDEVVHLLNGKYYKTSETQSNENINYLTQGFISYDISVLVEPSIVGPEDSHLNEHATDQVIKDLAAKIEGLIPARQ
ncbi:MAG: hypothetical protein QOJ02_2522 [Acidobacteriota bacterium]|nr:hypothetical protein [Acidobacteriota bacterium]